MKILVVGELNVDLLLCNYRSFPRAGCEVLVDDASLTLGSASAICAAGLARLGDRVAFIGKVGSDSWGDLVLDTMAKLRIDVSGIVRDRTTKTGITVSITSPADRALVTYLGSIAALTAGDVPDSAFRGCRHLHLSSFFLQQGLRPGVKSLLARAHRAGLTTSIDPGCDPAGEWGDDLVDALTETDIFLPNEVELAGVTGCRDHVRALRFLENGRTRTIAKLGAEGCLTIEGGETVHLPAFPITPVDTTGAGDSFNAGFLHAWLAGAGVLDSMRFACACGALSTQKLGGIASQPTEPEVRALFQSRQAAS
jgi:sugar/nucleoside kinase (ribokinase family)